MKNKIREMPIYIKAFEIFKLIHSFDSVLAEIDDDLIQSQRSFLIENGSLIPAKIAGAEGSDLYDIRMENAAIIRKAAREIFVTVGSFRYLGLKEEDYTNLIREKIDEFKILFREWVEGFDPSNYIYDDWGLFNPPGAQPDEDF